MRRSFFGGLRRRVGLRRRGWGCCRGVGPPATVRGSAGGVEPPAEVWGSAAGWTWCLPPRKPLFFRRQAPRLWGRAGRPPVGRGASLPASPCSFVDRHHVFRSGRADRRLGVVPPSPLALVLSSTSTTSLGPGGPTAGWAWCLPPRKPLFFRRQAPRL